MSVINDRLRHYDCTDFSALARACGEDGNVRSHGRDYANNSFEGEIAASGEKYSPSSVRGSGVSSGGFGGAGANLGFGLGGCLFILGGLALYGYGFLHSLGLAPDSTFTRIVRSGSQGTNSQEGNAAQYIHPPEGDAASIEAGRYSVTVQPGEIPYWIRVPPDGYSMTYTAPGHENLSAQCSGSVEGPPPQEMVPGYLCQPGQPVNWIRFFPGPNDPGPVTVYYHFVQSKTVSNAMSMRDILSDPDTFADPNNPGIYYLGYRPDDPKAPYYADYIAETKYIGVSLNKEPLSVSRILAEKYLQKKVVGAPADLCKISYAVNVANFVNSKYSGENLGFSFCPGAVPLPN